MHLIRANPKKGGALSYPGSALLLDWLWKVVPVILGGAGGYFFYRFVGCKTGGCPITGSPWLSTIYGAVLGLLFAAR